MDQSALHIMQVVMVLLLVLMANCQQHIFYIKPSNSSYCSMEVNVSQCYDLHSFISGEHWLSTPKATLLFLPGEHFLKLDLDVRNTEELCMIPYKLSNDSTESIRITCRNYGQTIHFQNVSFVKVDSISFHSCGVNGDSYGALQLRSVYHSEITNSKWYESRSSAIFIQDSSTVISDCQFMSANCSNCSGGGIHAETSNVHFTGSNVIAENTVCQKKHGIGEIFYSCEGGGMYLEYCTFTVTNTSFLLLKNNFACSGGGLYFKYVNAFIAGTAVFASNSAKHDGGGSSFQWSQCYFTGYTVYYNNSCSFAGGGIVTMFGHLAMDFATFTHNSASYGGAIYLQESRFAVDSLFSNNTVTLGEAVFANNTAELSGGGIAMNNSIFTFTGYVEFSANIAASGGGIDLRESVCVFKATVVFLGNKVKYSGGSLHAIQRSIIIFFTGYTEFSANIATNGGGIDLQNSVCTFKATAVFSGNRAKKSGGSLRATGNSYITFLSEITISSSRADLAGGGIIIRRNSTLMMSGEVHIEDSHANSYGGAIALDHSILRMNEGSEITRNSAQYGGAIHAISSKLHFIGDHSFISNSAQFGGGFSLSDGSLMYFSAKTHMRLISNYAHKYGGAIWVEDVPFYTCTNNWRCFYQPESYYFPKAICIFDNNSALLAGSNIYGGSINNCIIPQQIFLSVHESINSSPISSDPIQVCLCSQYNKPDCSILRTTIAAYSGQQFPLTLVGVGQKDGTVPAVVLSHTDPPSTDTVKTTGNKCSTLFYTINSDNPLVKLILYPERPCFNISVLTVFVKIKPCPPGFMLHDETKSCTCDDEMKRIDVQCDINTQSFAHKHGVWVDYNYLNDYNKTIIYHPHCPFDYCTQEWVNFTFNSTDNQCRYNRSGLICGACKEGYSLTLSGSKCTQCSHVYLLLFFPLAAAGVVLVFFLLTLRLTVSVGTINGLIFFANIIGTNLNIFLPPECNIILRVFIAWLNLDLGISTCLFDEMDMYVKVWLQFIFPFYVFTLTGIIIVLSRHSITFTKCLGSDPVAVLATLILLAYTKLFRTILNVMSFTYIQSSDGSSITVWLYDGNVRYLSGKHIPLFLFALLILLLLIVPYTMILLFAPCLLHCSQNRFLFWIDDRRLKPFFFSYYAPLKNKYRSWISILLLLRLCLLILFVSNFLGDPSINLLAITAVVIFMSCLRVLFGTFYTKWYLDALELFFIMNLGLFSVFTLYAHNSSGNQRALSDTNVSITFIVFIAVTVYHGWRQLTDSRWWRHTLKPKWKRYLNFKNEESQRTQEHHEQCEEPQSRQVPTTFIDLRESLLESR